MQEYRVYVLETDTPGVYISGYDLENWKNYEDEKSELLEEAKEFISLCEQNGGVYSLTGFMDALNFEEVNVDNLWVYITNNY